MYSHIFSIVFLLSVSFLSFSSAARIGFNVGSAVGLKDIIADGVAVNGWDQQKQFNDTFWPPAVLYLWLGEGGDASQAFEVDLLHSGSIEYNASSVLTGTLVVGGEPVMLFTNVLCQNEGVGTGVIAFKLTGLSDILLNFQKECIFPVFNVGYHSSDGYQPFIIDDNKNVPGWYLNATQDMDVLQFYLWLDSSVLPYSPFVARVTSTDTRNFYPKLTLPNGSTAKPEPKIGTPAYLRVLLDCPGNRPKSMERATITITPTGWDSDPKHSISFSFYKECGDLSGNNRKGFRMTGTTNFVTETIIADGIVLPGSFANEPGRPYGPDFTTLNWNLMLDHVDGFPDAQLYNLNFTIDADYEVVKLEVVGATLSFLSVGQPQPIKLQPTCVADGVANIKAQIFVNGYDTMTVYFQMTCTFPHFSLIFYDTANYIVNNSDALPFFYLTPAYTSIDRFVVFLDDSSPVQQQHYAINNLGYDPKNMTVTVDNGYGIAYTGFRSQFSLQFDCPINTPASINAIQFELDFGWNVSYQVSYQKQCPYIPRTNKSSWTAAGIFFFTVFILLLAFFIFGSIYKYFVENKRGVEIIPGISYYRRCYRSVTDRSETHYTPQIPSDYSAASDRDERRGNYGSYTYQTNL